MRWPPRIRAVAPGIGAGLDRQKAVRTAQREEIAGPGQRVVITAGVQFGTPGSTNILRIAWVER